MLRWALAAATVGVGLADDLDVARVDRLLQHLLLAAAQEVGVRVGGRALDHHVVARGRLPRTRRAPASGRPRRCRRSGRRRDRPRSGDRRRRPGCPRRPRPRPPDPIAWVSWASTISALAPSRSGSRRRRAAWPRTTARRRKCTAAPAASSAATIAASSVFQRSSWKFDQLTPTVMSCASAVVARPEARTAAASVSAMSFMTSQMAAPIPVRLPDTRNPLRGRRR
jgi:hypothetical protein